MELQNNSYGFKTFSRYASIKHGVSTRKFGSMKNHETKEPDRDALTKFAKIIDITDPIVCMKQIHSGNVSIIENTDILQISDTDGLVTNKKHIPLAILTADCLPILFFDPQKKVIGVAHAGYKGLLNHIIENTLSVFVSKFKSDPKDIIVGIGPSIETTCYEVGVELVEKFQEEFPSFEDIFIEKDQKYFLDLRGIAQQSLIKEGILDEHIEIMDVCTKDNKDFYSYRGGDGDMRFVSVISLV